MNRIERSALVYYRDKFVQDLDVKYIYEKLLAYEVITYSEMEEIESEKLRADKVRKLLDLLVHSPKKNSETFQNFIKTLKEHYDWLAVYLTTFSNPDNTDAGHLTPEERENADLISKLQDCLIKGGVPYPPPHLIPRDTKVNEVRELLSSMKRGEFLVIHGMPGVGKSVLASECVRSLSIAVNLFKENIFWITVGQVEKDTLLAKMQALCECLQENAGTSLPPLSVDQAIERIRKLITRENLRDCLIVLDDVWRGEILRSFDVGCRVLATTREINISDAVQDRAILYKMQDGFTREESMRYLSSCTHIPVENLPIQASEIYEESKGSPMVLSLMGPVLADQRQGSAQDPGRWNHYLNKLKDRKYTKMTQQSSYSHQTVEEAIRISVDNLDYEKKALFQELVVFVDDVNIPAQALEMLWGMSTYDVEEIMRVFIDKSLIAHHVNSATTNVLYGIHDLLLDYLNVSISAEDQVKAHRKLVDAYLHKCNRNYGNLPNDNYIFWFMAYHLYKGEYFELFPKIFLDFDFIAAKLRVTGPSDLLNDYRKYSGYISPDVDAEKETEDFARFVRICGHLIVQYSFLDIVQLALEQPKSSAVYRAALRAARNRDKFYLEWRNQEAAEKRAQALRSMVLCRGLVTAACFASTTTRLLSSIGDGQIRLWDVDSGKELHHMTGHSSTVHHLSLSHDGSRIVSASADGTCKIWDLHNVLQSLDGTLDTMQTAFTHTTAHPTHCSNPTAQRKSRTPSPRMRQDSWHNMFDVNGRVIEDSSLVTFFGHASEVLWAEFNPNGALVVSCGTDKTARVWLSTAPVELFCLEHDDIVHTCCYSPSGDYIATGSADSTIRLWAACSSMCVAVFHENRSRVIYTSFLTDLSMVSVSDMQILLWKWADPRSTGGSSPPATTFQEIGANSKCHYQCAALSDDRKLLAVANTDEKVIVYSTEESAQVAEYVGHNAEITSLHLKDSSLLTASADETVMVWKINIGEQADPQYSAAAFDTCWVNGVKDNLLIATAAVSDNKIQVMSGVECQVFHTTDPEVEIIERCCISHDGSMIAYCTRLGSIKLVSMRNKTQREVGTHASGNGPANLCFSPSDKLILSASSDGSVSVWNPKGSCLHISGSRKGIAAAYFVMEEAATLLCGADGSLNVWTTDNGNLISLLPEDSRGNTVTCVDLSPCKTLLAQGIGSQGLQLVKIDPSDMKMVKQTMRIGHLQQKPVRCCRFSKDGPFLAAGYDNGTIEIWDYKTFCPELILEAHKSWVRDVRFVSSSPFFQLVSVGDCIIWWDLTKKRRNVPGSVSLPSTPLASLTRYMNVACEETLVQSFQFHGRFASKLFISNDGEILVTVTDAGTLYVLRHLAS